MAIKCPKCARVYELSDVDMQQSVICICGEILCIDHDDVFGRLHEICRQYELRLEEEKAAQIRKMADSIVFLILNTNKSWDKVELEKNKLRLMISDILPGKEHLYDLIYEPRFKRLWQKFRETGSE